MSTFEFKARRSPVLARHGMVACTQPLAAEAGLSILKAGGNAVDAAVAIAACLNVTEPTSTGIGGDAFCLYFEKATGKLHALNASGRCPAGLTLEAARAAAAAGGNPDSLPPRHIHNVTVPGAAAGWCDAAEKWGTMPLGAVLKPAIDMAREGFPVAPVAAAMWAKGEAVLKKWPHPEEMLMPDGTAPKAGSVFANPTLAGTFEALAAEGKPGFYSGRIGEAIVAAVQAQGGTLTLEDMAAHVSTFPEPISVEYKGHTVYEVPPNGQGITALIALNILDAVPAVDTMEHNSAPYLHTLIEAMRLAFADAAWYVADPDVVHVPIAELLSKPYGASRAAGIDPACAAADVIKGSPTAVSNTVSFQVVDAFGNACSFINSNYEGFGSGLIPRGCGFTLQNRGHNFSLQDGHPNVLAGGKRPYHTIIPAMILRDGAFHASISVMGGFMQPQGHVQLIKNLIDFGMDPQLALDKARFCVTDGKGPVVVEDGVDPEVVEALRGMGHDIRVYSGTDRVAGSSFAGRGQAIVLRDGVLWGGSDGRGDGMALGY